MKSLRWLNVVVAVHLALCLSACPGDRTGGVKTPPIPALVAPNVTSASQHFISREDGTKATHKLVQLQLSDEDSEDTRGSMRWLKLCGAVLVALGCAIAYFEGPKLGTAVIVFGFSLVGIAMAVPVLDTYAVQLTLVGCGVGLIAALAHFIPKWTRDTKAKPST